MRCSRSVRYALATVDLQLFCRLPGDGHDIRYERIDNSSDQSRLRHIQRQNQRAPRRVWNNIMHRLHDGQKAKITVRASLLRHVRDLSSEREKGHTSRRSVSKVS